ncbi:alpha/beta hydrolase [Ramlibacter tataouinensis]|uniref:alpha/beta fold hydrolase n=1 Tax=Ramlibacter tataouinensis TaxID=94132 RepID=UPI0022F3E0E9|nr:alpha/beta hydrolase [Ramlibacter tataouinensis]WBY01415.1 alpha/beta hydrolase [Ramlibacter tataouinensis]
MPISPYVREAGAGPTVLCLHANASHSGQWRPLMDPLSGRFRVLAADTYGAGKSPPTPPGRPLRLADEVELIHALLASAPEGVHLVGHSYGAAIAFKAALMHPPRVLSLAVYEPTLFAMVDRDTPRPNGTEGIQQVVREGIADLERGDAEAAARAFIDFWMGEGSYERTPPERRPSIVDSCRNLPQWSHALLTEPATLDELRQVSVPVLYMVGGRSPESSRCVAERVIPVLPNVRWVDFPDLGHMAPVTHPEPVNAAIAAFLDKVAAPTA